MFRLRGILHIIFADICSNILEYCIYLLYYMQKREEIMHITNANEDGSNQ